MELLWRRARLIYAAVLLIAADGLRFIAHGLSVEGDRELCQLERELGLDRPAQPFTWDTYTPRELPPPVVGGDE